MTSIRKSLVLASAISVLGIGMAFAQTDPAPAGGDAAAPAPAGGDKMSGSMGKKHMMKKHMSKKHMKKM